MSAAKGTGPPRERRFRGQLKALECALDQMREGIVVLDRNGRLLLSNPAARRMVDERLMLAAPERHNSNGTSLLLEGGRPCSPDELPLARALRGETVHSAQIFVRKPGAPDGVWLGVNAYPLRNENGELNGAVAVFRDATEQRQAEEERARLLASEYAARREIEQALETARRREARLKLLLDASGVLLGSIEPGGMLRVVLDLAQKLIPADAYAASRVNPSAESGLALLTSGLSKEFENEAGRLEDCAREIDAPVAFQDIVDAPLTEKCRELYRAEGIRSALAVPFRSQGKLSGGLWFFRREPQPFDESEIWAASALANLAAAAIGAANLYEDQKRMRAEAQAAERRAAFLADATALLGSSLDYETTLAQVARMAVPRIADWCAVSMVETDGSVRQLAVAHSDPARAQSLRNLAQRYPLPPDSPFGVPHVLRTGESEIVSAVTDTVLAVAARSEEQLEMLRNLGIVSYMCVPVVARGRTLGAISFLSTQPGRHYGRDDLAIAEHLGRRAGLAIDNARLYATAHRERAAAQEALESALRSEKRFRRLVESGIMGIILGEGDVIVDANDVFLNMIGYTREDLAEGLRWAAITAPEYAHAGAKAQSEMLANGACAPYETEYVRKDGTRLPALIGAVLLEGAPRFSWVCFVVDLTERRRLEQRLRESQKLESIGLLAGGVAHDFNNLLTGILGNASLALEELPVNHPVRPILENVILASERAAHLTRQLLAYSGKGRFIIQPVNISELVREIGALLRMTIPKKVHLRLELEDKLPPVEADSSQIQQLVMNLVLNGAEAIGDAIGTVVVTTGVREVDETYSQSALMRDELAPGKYVYLEVHDTGCGMDEQTKARIFDPFFTTKFTGRGLGLAAALGIVRGHKGDIKVYSTPGRGSTFKVLLPAAAGSYTEAAPEVQYQELQGMGTLLIVDDEDIVLKTGKVALERYGYRVLAASNGREALDIFREASGEISLVLLDMTMPVMSGEETLAELRRIRPDVRVVVSSGYNELEAVRRFRGAAVAGFIQKPYTAAQLAGKVKAVLEGRARGLGAAEGQSSTP
ncbi:MAG TPA: PAS domain S-box protein [Bryobacteraceae bacterium]|nr:PAS domain S-box protein [Bryobacteraceae bacterium]HOQ43738.1 PAS domain S-box protein [Bryobacteraceae bacterium]HPU71819.1 PAS domain S-box protein [Bryobacteraceae bacterium]